MYEETEVKDPNLAKNSDEVQEIITAIPSWLMRRGITFIFMIILLMIAVSAFISFPDIVKSNVIIHATNSPKSVYARQSGKLIKVLIKDGTFVKSGVPLAFIESTGSHEDILKLNTTLLKLKQAPEINVAIKDIGSHLKLGELQVTYEEFYNRFLEYESSVSGGYYLRRKNILLQELKKIDEMNAQIKSKQKTQTNEHANEKDEFDMYKKLYDKKVISLSEFKQRENKYLAAGYPLQQSSVELLNNSTLYTAKKKEILDIEHVIADEKLKFLQALNILITQSDAWINLYVLRSPIAGKVNFSGIIEENQTVNVRQEIFVMSSPGNEFYGEIQIPQYNMGKVKVGLRTLVRLKSFPFEEFGMISGRLKYVSDVAFNDSVFLGRISLERFENKNNKIVLKNGMKGEVQIIAKESTLLRRLLRNITQLFNSR